MAVAPEATVAGPLMVTVGAAPLEWHPVQVGPVLPDRPEMPVGYRAIRMAEELSATSSIIGARARIVSPVRLISCPFITYASTRSLADNTYGSGEPQS